MFPKFCNYFLNFNLAKNCWTVSARALIINTSIPSDKTFKLVPSFFFNYPVTLTLKYWLLLENFTLVNNVWTLSARALIFQMIEYSLWQNLSVCTHMFDLWPWPWSQVNHTFKRQVLDLNIPYDKIFLSWY